ncbi:Multicopper oxidase with three cupredoxin domains (includes cell division protein FtsP and spore coat protein CotA) [Raineyella antarctica]|uniref:Multicopper oxidase with three cupredoxin domains (Includes cell division protein FtsP and spore coat protein CotA) n=1 Tax=Raineyella antarctica TaxID=1577474 RepID=A0A1G6GEM9_9ACTN|nr:multicopper oxidase family protein [Raineyella antarctica]SDB80458.1 Multicopper oxidase with three cupredoxin domains (includes cell division protein FtsP and spore coat protein CotA) [Raineyella antarctica]
MSSTFSRRSLLLSGLGGAAALSLAACTRNPGTTQTAAAVASATPLSPGPGQNVVSTTLTPREVTLDLGGGVTARTWAYDDKPVGPVIRATAGSLLQVDVRNQLPASTSVHWHGIHLRNAADGVPGVTQQPIEAGATYRYEFVAPDPGTYFYHPHSGVQLDRGLYAPLIIDDPHEPGGYDAEWIVVLDDWTDGIGKGPDDILADFRAEKGTVGTGMGGMGSGGMGSGGMGSGGMGSGGMGGMHGGGSGSPLGDAGDIAYPHYLVNGRIATDPAVFEGKKGQRVRIRLINAASDTVFRVGLASHEMTVTHTDGFPVRPTPTRALFIAMGERFDLTVTLGDGVFPLVAQPEGKTGAPARALVRTSGGTAPSPQARIGELDTEPLLATALSPVGAAKLPDAAVDQTLDFQLNGQMQPYAWGINGKQFPNDEPLTLREGQRVRMRMTNMTSMVHPMHIHGHTWALPGSNGLRKDTVLVLPMQTIEADLQADNPGTWMYHCHNIYHAEMGMMTRLVYA